MSAQRVNAVDKELEKYIKFLALKSAQVVVQSRLGEKIQTQCNPLGGNDWFNIVVQDHPDVLDETKRALALKPGDSILQRLPLCIEISLKTSEGDKMILEVWSLDLLPVDNKKEAAAGEDCKGEGCNTNICNDSQTLKAPHAIYNRMSIMLKSLISLTRTTPAYKLSRRQCPDSYSIFYLIYVDRPKVHTLGEGHKQVKIGQLNTILGSLTMSVAYRTKLTISPTAGHQVTAAAHQGEQQNTIMLKSDHFRPASDVSSPTQQLATVKFGAGVGGTGTGTANDKRFIDIEKPLRPGAFTDLGKLRQFTEHDFVLPETPPFEWMLRRTRHESNGSGSIESLNRKCESPVNNNNNNNINGSNNNINHNHNNNNNSTAFKSFEKPTVVVPCATSPIKSLLIPASSSTLRHNSAPTLQEQQAPAQQPPPDDDSLLKELHFPFASPTSHVNDLAKFYRECYHAPPLRGLSELQVPNLTSCGASAAASATAAASALASTAAVTADGSMDDLSRQLEQFETSLEDYDKLVSQFGLSGSSSTGSRSSGGLQMSN